MMTSPANASATASQTANAGPADNHLQGRDRSTISRERSSSSSWRELGQPDSNGNAVQHIYSSHPTGPNQEERLTSSIHSREQSEIKTSENQSQISQDRLESGIVSKQGPSFVKNLNEKLAKVHVESTGIVPIPLENRLERKWWSVGMLWFSANTNVLSFSTGALASLFGLDMKGALLTIFFFCLLCSLAPAYFCTFGPKLGMRQMVHTRYSWGFFGASLIALLNCATMLGFTILNAIVGGQAISAVSPNASLSDSVGIVIIAVIALIVSFAGIKVVHLFERWLWVPVLISFIILLGVAGSGPDGLHVNPDLPKSTVSGVLALGSVIAGFLISWAALASDVSLYCSPLTTPSWGLFLVTYFGFFLSSAPLMMVGAAFSISSLDIPSWDDAYSKSIGSLFDLILSGEGGIGNFGKFITVLLALSIVGNIAPTMYCFSCSFMVFLPILSDKFPRFIFPFLATAIYLPLAIVGANSFYETLTNFTSVLGYWSCLFVGVVTADHVVIRRLDFKSYQRDSWNDWRKLPLGLAAIGSAALSLAVLIPSIDQVWFVGPIAKKSGDLGFELGFIVCFLLYVPLRILERRLIR